MSEGFFDTQARLTPKRTNPGDIATPSKQAAPLTVSQLTARIDRAIKTGFPAPLLVQGEISNYNYHRPSGNCYFTLKDSANCIDCVIFKSDFSRIKFVPKDGMELIANGRVAIYGSRGKYQLYVSNLQPVGQGALELAFQQLRVKLEAEGLFAAHRKRPLPRFPARIALITSRQTAALQDMLKVLRRFSWVKLLIFHVPVQGEGAGAKIAEALRCLSDGCDSVGGVDLILLARGGGSFEDLWAFNEEIVARAIVASRVAVVTGIGHEVDTSIADLVADYHAHTPTEAAQVVSQHWRLASDSIDASVLRLRRGLRNLVQHSRQRLIGIERHEVFRRPLDRVNALRQLLDDRQRGLFLSITERVRELTRQVQSIGEQRLAYAQGARLRRASDALGKLASSLEARHPRHAVQLYQQRLTALDAGMLRAARQSIVRRNAKLDAMQKQLDLLDPLQILKRGYSITTLKRTGATLRRPLQVRGGEKLLTRLAEGEIESVAEDPKQPKLFL